jgi:hypothetical protein
MRIVALLGLALVCGGCTFEAPPVDAAAYPTPAPAADNSEAAPGWWQPFGDGAQFVAVNWLDDLRHPRAKRETYDSRQLRQSAPAYRDSEPRSVPRPAPSPDRGINTGKNFGGPA